MGMEKSEAEVGSLPTPPARPKTSFANDVLKLVSGTTIAQLLGISATPILTRLYAPEAFGLLALFTSITSILGVIVCLRYELAIMLPESDEEAVNLLGVSLLFTLLISLLTIPVVWWGREPLMRWLNAPELGSYLWFVPLLVFISGIFLALNYWNSRTKHFGRLSVARVSSSVATTVAKLGFGFGGLATGGALIGSAVGGQALATMVLSGQIWRDDGKLFLRAIRPAGMLSGIRRYRKFPMLDTWSALLNTVSWQLPAFLLSAFFSPIVVGYYALGYRILQMPMSLVGSAISQVFFQRASESYMQGSLDDLVEETFRRLIMFGLFPMFLLTFVGRDLFVVLFGITWAEAGIYTQILSIWAFFWFISSPLSTVFSVIEKQEYLLKFNAINFVTRFVSLWVGGVFQQPIVAIFLFSSTGVLVYGYLTMSALRHAGVSLRKATRILGSYLILFVPVAGILAYFAVINVGIELRLSTAGVLFVCYLLFIVQTEFAFWSMLTKKFVRNLSAKDVMKKDT
jgi:lipopolysaccharide exporter